MYIYIYLLIRVYIYTYIHVTGTTLATLACQGSIRYGIKRLSSRAWAFNWGDHWRSMETLKYRAMGLDVKKKTLIMTTWGLWMLVGVGPSIACRIYNPKGPRTQRIGF